MVKILISSLIIVFYSTVTFALDGEFKINKRYASIYDSNDNLVINLKKGDSVCICDKPNHSDTQFSTWYSVCDINDKVIGSIYNDTIGPKISRTCSASFVQKNNNIYKELININNETSIMNKNKKYDKFLKKFNNISSSQFKKTYVDKLFFSKSIYQLTEYGEESFNQHALATFFSKNGDYFEFFVKKNKNDLVEFGAFEGKWYELYKDTIKVDIRNGFYKYPNNDSVVKETFSWGYLLKIYKKDKNILFSTSNDDFDYEGAELVTNSLKYTDISLQLVSLNNLLNFVKKYSNSKDSTFIISDVSNKFTIDNDEKVLALKNENVIVNNNIEVNEDTIKPKIIVDNLFESNSSLIAIVEGSISDQSEIAVLTMNGYEIALNNNNFSKEFFVKPKGQEIEIVAIDIHGNKSSKIISLKRQKETIQQVKFDFLNPTKIQNKLNNNKAALIIGVESYENTFTALYAENDALYFNDYANTSLGVPKENIKLLVNNDAERNDTLKVISKWLPTVVKEDQTELFVYFSGHGLASEDGKDLYLLPTDGDPDLLELTALMRNQLFDQISSLNPKSVTVFLDTCYSGATRSDELLVASRPIFIEAEEQEVPTNFTIFSASAGKETAKVLKEAEHGLFSYFMMKGLEGEADSNNDRTITNGELHAFINKNVSRQANQTPQLNGNPEQVLVTW